MTQSITRLCLACGAMFWLASACGNTTYQSAGTGGLGGGPDAGFGETGPGGGGADGGGAADSGIVNYSLVGTWKGYVESYQFASGSDAILLVITDEAPHGYIVFGQGTAPPVATDPEVGYPPLVETSMLPYEGFEYTLRAGDVTGDRVRFEVSSTELWKDWCALQSPIQSSSGYNCIPSGIFDVSQKPSSCAWHDPESGQWVAIDCAKLHLCMFGVCQCTANACQAKPENDISFDLDHEGNALDGSVVLSAGVRNIRLDKE